MIADNELRVPMLAFIYKLYTDVTFQELFKVDPEKAMDQYKLTWEQKIAIYHSGADPKFVTTAQVRGYPILLDPAKVTGKPNPVTGDWWAAYARYIADKESGLNPTPVPNPKVNDRAEVEVASMAGVMALLGQELGKAPKWGEVW